MNRHIKLVRKFSKPLSNHIFRIDILCSCDEINAFLYCMGGGMTDSIPLAFFQQKGYERNVVILTQPDGYIKEHNRLMPLMRLALRKYPRMIEAMDKRHLMYNEEVEYVRQAEQEGRCLVIRPQEKLPIGHISHDPEEMQHVYDIGIETGRKYLTNIKRFLSSA